MAFVIDISPKNKNDIVALQAWSKLNRVRFSNKFNHIGMFDFVNVMIRCKTIKLFSIFIHPFLFAWPTLFFCHLGCLMWKFTLFLIQILMQTSLVAWMKQMRPFNISLHRFLICKWWWLNQLNNFIFIKMQKIPS